MSNRIHFQVGILTLAALLGLVVGLSASLVLWPVTCASASPADLSRESQCLWAAAVAEGYALNDDLNEARKMISLLGDNASDVLCSVARGRCESCTEDARMRAEQLASAIYVGCGGIVP